ncbi:MAG TPA: hypothetical protein VD758_10615 [Gemmatimonadaceae bacterium]|nr:hypothetical protein [Gemmatimonadaceae bacterium]
MNSTSIDAPEDSARPIVFVIDVEPDDRKTERNKSGWESSEDALNRLEVLRGELETATGREVKYNWFFRCDTQIAETYGRADYVAEACPRVIRAVTERGDAAGIHVHLWRWDNTHSRWFNDFADKDWIAECLTVSIESFQNIFGHRPDIARFGDRWLSQQAVDLMIEAGIRYDITVEPGLPGGGIHDDPYATGALPDYRGAARFPWQPSPGNCLEPSSSRTSDGLWMIPVSTTRPSWRLVRRAPYFMRASRSPNLALRSSYVWPHLQKELATPSRTPLVTVFRSGDLSNARFRRNFEATTSQLARHPGLQYCEFTDPRGAIAHWLSGNSGS